MQNDNQRYIYIVISQTGTMLSRILKIITGARYNHASISLSKDLQTMYSFGRLWAYNPFYGGFVQESLKYGTFRRFPNADVVVAAIPVAQERYQQMEEFLADMYLHRKKYHYNYIGLLMAGAKIHYCSKNTYYCSEFVRDVLIQFEVLDSEQFSPIVQPVHILEQVKDYVIYRGKLKQYVADKMIAQK